MTRWSRGDHPRPARGSTAPTTGSCGRRRAPRRWTSSPSSRCADRPGRADRLRPADAGDDRHRDARAGPHARARGQAPAADGVRRHRRRDPGDQRHRPRLLPAQAVGPAGGAALPGRRRPARRLAREQPRPRPRDVRVVGHRWSDRSHEIKTFLARNHVPYRWFDVERDDEAQRLRELAGRRRRDLPARARARRRRRCASPSTLELADALGLRTSAEQPLYDVCIVGGGPAGLAAAVYAASEGLSTVVVEREAPGGQAGQSAAIENYLGFPKGLSGADLTQRAVAQVVAVRRRDGAGPRRRRPRDPRAGARGAASTGGGEIEARARDRRDRRVLPAARGAAGSTELTGRGVYYGATASEAQPVRGRRRLRRRRGELRRPGGAQPGPLRRSGSCWSSAADSLEDSMSQLPRRADRAPRRTSRCGCRTEVVAGARRRSPRGAHARRPRHRAPARRCRRAGCSSSSARRRAPTGSATTVVRDEHGFVVTGQDLLASAARRRAGRWPRAPFALETSVPGRVRRRRRPARLDEAGRVGRRRGRDVGLPRPPLPGDDLMRARRSCGPLDLFDGLTDEQLRASWSRPATRCAFEPGEDLFHEGEPADFWWVLLEGALDLVRHVGREDTVVGADGRPGPLGRRLPRLGRARRLPGDRPRQRRRARAPGAGRGAARPGRRLVPVRRPPDRGAVPAPRATSRRRPASGRRWSPSARSPPGSRTRSTTRRRPRPARSTRSRATCQTLLVVAAAGSPRARSRPRSSPRSTRCAVRSAPAPPRLDPLAVADREDELSAWLRRPRRRARDWVVAPPLAAAGVDVAWCERVATVLDGPALEPGLEWVASTLSAADAARAR